VSVLAVAHRAGNSPAGLQAAARVGADVVEADVHDHRGRLEVRHSKSMGPLPWLWDRNPWELTPTSVPQLQLGALLEAVPPGTGLMLDLKGVGQVGRRTLEALHARRPELPVLVCSRWWPSVEAHAGVDWVRPVLSARNRGELLRLRRRVRAGIAPYGVSLHGSLLSAPVVAELRERVALVMTWGVNDLDRLAQVLALGVSGVISDSSEVLAAVRRQRYERSSQSSGK
jgi:glycerophosphoryl diester phosphodiesterase